MNRTRTDRDQTPIASMTDPNRRKIDPNTGTGNSNPKLAGRRSTYLTRTTLGPLEDCWRGKILAPSIKSIAQKEIFTFTPKSPPTKKSKNQTPLIGSDADEETNQTLQILL